MTFDVAIAGGGPAGAAAAIALAREGRTCVVFERTSEPRLRPGETLPPIARLPLESLGLWQRFVADGHASAVGNRSLWGSEAAAENDFIRSPYGAGWHLDRRRFEAMLLDEAARAGAEVRRGVEAARIEQRGDGWRINDDVEARFAIDATGRPAVLARVTGAERVSIDQLIGITAFFDDTDCDAFTVIEAAEHGWWYSAPLPNRRLVVALMTDSDIAARASLRERANWIGEAARTSATRTRIAKAKFTGELQISAANSSRLTAVAGRKWLAAGDAALSFDPLSSQGLDTALSCGVEAARAIVAGTDAALLRYATTLTKIWTDYLVDRARYYGVERRWPSSPFWERRQTHAQAIAV